MIEWRTCVGYPDYEISNDGQLRRRVAFRNLPVGMIKKAQRHSRGYLYYALGHDKKELAHRLVAMTFIGPPPSDRHEVAHNDGSRTNNVASNLRWALPTENQADRMLHGTDACGAKSMTAKIGAQEARSIVSEYAMGGQRYVGGAVTMQEIADRHGISIAQVSRIVNGRRWQQALSATS